MAMRNNTVAAPSVLVTATFAMTACLGGGGGSSGDGGDDNGTARVTPDALVIKKALEIKGFFLTIWWS